MKEVTRSLFVEIQEGRGAYDRYAVLNTGAWDTQFNEPLRKRLVERIGETDSEFLFKHEVALIMCKFVVCTTLCK